MAVKQGNTEQWELNPNSLPDDIALAIASFLEEPDVCSLGSCSQFWRGVCASDCIWMGLSKKRWPSIIDGEASTPNRGWRNFYIRKHNKLATDATSVIEYVNQCSQNESLEAGNYLNAINDLSSIKLGFKDVQLLLFSRKHSVLVNLIGLHYCIFWLRIPCTDVMKALLQFQVFEREVYVTWFKLGRWFYGFRLPDECRSRKISLCELTTSMGDEILRILNRGAVHEVLRVKIAKVNREASCSSKHPTS